MYTLSSWKPEKILAIGSWIGSSLIMIRGGFLSAKERTALQAVMRHPRWSRGEARWPGPCGHHSVSSPRSSNRTCGFPASGFPTGFTSKHTAVGQDGPDVVGSHRTPRTRPYRGNAWCLATTPCGRFRLRLDVELPPMAPELLGCCQDHRHSPLLAIPNSLQNPKILVGYDPEVVCDGVALGFPLFGQSSAKEIEDGFDEVAEARMELVVGHFAVHDSP